MSRAMTLSQPTASSSSPQSSLTLDRASKVKPAKQLSKPRRHGLLPHRPTIPQPLTTTCTLSPIHGHLPGSNRCVLTIMLVPSSSSTPTDCAGARFISSIRSLLSLLLPSPRPDPHRVSCGHHHHQHRLRPSLQGPGANGTYRHQHLL